MPKNCSVEDFLGNMSLLEAGAVLHTSSSVDQNILTVPCRLAESFEEECIDTSELNQQDIQRIREEDPFMYHSILQHFRKMRSSFFSSDPDGMDDELGCESHCPADTAQGLLFHAPILGKLQCSITTPILLHRHPTIKHQHHQSNRFRLSDSPPVPNKFHLLLLGIV
eukprot:CCRYP_016253-RA/>CCRYP_016253-RA protein AED:0.30 eAED:0.30 QI:0/-1/0/1/-1/1/1/0/166